MHADTEINGLPLRLHLCGAVDDWQFGERTERLLRALARVGLIEGHECDLRAVTVEQDAHVQPIGRLTRTRVRWACGAVFHCWRPAGFLATDISDDDLRVEHAFGRREQP